MSHSMDFWAEISLNRQQYSSITEVEDKIEEHEAVIELYKEQLLIGTALNPKDLKEDTDSSLIYTIREHVIDIMDSLEESFVEIYKLTLLKENFDKAIINE